MNNQPSTSSILGFILQAALLAAAAITVYLPSTHAGFIWDDDSFLTKNPLMAAPDALRRFWLTASAPDYFPLASTTLWIGRQLWGLDPLGYHLVNIAFHALNTMLFWLILRHIAAPGAWVAALIFSLHPIQVESVAWITQIKTVQSTFFYLLAAYFYLRHDADGSRSDYCFSLLAFLLALLSKTSVVMLPVVMLLYHWWKNTPDWKTATCRAAPFFALGFGLAMVTILFQYNSAGAKGAEWDIDFAERFVNAGHSASFYLYKLALPVDLAFVYPRWKFDIHGTISYLPHIGWIALLAAAYVRRDTWGRPLLFGAGYYLVSLFPVLGFFNIYFMLYSFVADHWQYVAGQGAIALAVAGAHALCQRLPAGEKTFAALAALVAAALAVLTWNQQAIYQDKTALWQDTLRKNPGAWMAHNDMGIELELQSRVAEAVPHYIEALRLKPNYAPAEDNLGLALLKLGNPQEAKAHFLKAIRLKPDFWEPHNNLGTILANEGNDQDAIRHFETALNINPNVTEAHNNLALLLGKYGRHEDALEHLNQALRNPAIRPSVHNNIGNVLLDTGKPAEAAAHFRQALEIQPDFEPARISLEKVLQKIKAD